LCSMVLVFVQHGPGLCLVFVQRGPSLCATRPLRGGSVLPTGRTAGLFKTLPPPTSPPQPGPAPSQSSQSRAPARTQSPTHRPNAGGVAAGGDSDASGSSPSGQGCRSRLGGRAPPEQSVSQPACLARHPVSQVSHERQLALGHQRTAPTQEASLQAETRMRAARPPLGCAPPEQSVSQPVSQSQLLDLCQPPQARTARRSRAKSQPTTASHSRTCACTDQPRPRRAARNAPRRSWHRPPLAAPKWGPAHRGPTVWHPHPSGGRHTSSAWSPLRPLHPHSHALV
jgi:hypothetical protein